VQVVLNQSRTRLSSPLILLTALTVLNCAPAVAQSNPENSNDRATIQQLMKRIEELENSQKQLQEKIDKVGSAPAQAAAPSTEAVAAQSQPDAASSDRMQETKGATTESEHSETAHVLGPVEFRGFGDIDWGRPWFEKLPPGGLAGSKNSFTIGDFDLFTNTRISEHWSLLGELLVTSDFTNEFGVEMDRMLLSYKKNDYFKISFGKFQTALGYYTNNFHRAQYFQPAIGRPIMYSDEDNNGILPTHSIGVTATGLIPSGGLGLHWVGEVSNGRSSILSSAPPIQNFSDDNNGKAVNVAVYVRPEKLHGFQAGVSIYRNSFYPEGFSQIRQTISTGHIVYAGSRFEWLNEASLLRHVLSGSDETFRSLTGYSQVSWKLRRTRPYFRYDYQRVPAGDPIFGYLGRSNGPSIGVSQRLSSFVILKLQGGRLYGSDGKSANAVQTQVAFAF